jgi:hypothetical protein
MKTRILMFMLLRSSRAVAICIVLCCALVMMSCRKQHSETRFIDTLIESVSIDSKQSIDALVSRLLDADNSNAMTQRLFDTLSISKKASQRAAIARVLLRVSTRKHLYRVLDTIGDHEHYRLDMQKICMHLLTPEDREELLRYVQTRTGSRQNVGVRALSTVCNTIEAYELGVYLLSQDLSIDARHDVILMIGKSAYFNHPTTATRVLKPFLDDRSQGTRCAALIALSTVPGVEADELMEQALDVSTDGWSPHLVRSWHEMRQRIREEPDIQPIGLRPS